VVEYFVHGIHVVIESEWSRFLTYAALNLGAFASRRPTTDELRVAVSIRRKPWFPPPPEELTPRVTEERWGDDLLSDGRNVRFRSGFASVEFSIGPPPDVRATYLIDRKSRLAGLLNEVPRWEEIQRVTRLALYLPLFHLLERSGSTVLHAAAVASKSGAVVLAGLNGSGKSTLCAGLLGALEYMSDNYVLWTGKELLGFPEALRIPQDRAPPSASHHPSVWGKRLVPPDPSRIALSAKPSALVFLTLGSRTAMTPLEESEAVRRLEIIQDMTAEFPRYGYLGPLSPPRNPTALQSLASSAPSFGLVVGDLRTACAKILELAGEPTTSGIE
jgi:hypothetical protein